MECLKYFSCCLTTIVILLCIVHNSISYTEFLCVENIGTKLPSLPPAYSTNIKINFETNDYTTELKYAVNEKKNKLLLDFKTKERKVTYIVRGDQDSVLVITYKKDEHPKCVVKKNVKAEYMESEDAGPSSIIQKASLAMAMPSKFGPAGGYVENGVYLSRWEGCFKDPKVNVSISFAAENWRQPYTSSLTNAAYPVQAEALIKGATDDEDVSFTALYSNFDPNTPDDTVFQPPEDVYCEGFRADVSPPKMPDYFSYNAEILVYESALGVAPFVSNRRVYYDYPDRISRIDFYDPLADNSDIFSTVKAKEKSIIHDFNAGNQYNIDLYTGECTLDAFKSTFSVITSKPSKGDDMLTGRQFFWFGDTKVSYNGQYPVRGLMANVFTSITTDPQTQNKTVVSWYFKTNETRLVETGTVGKETLLRMSVRPLTDFDKEGVVVVNFYNFAKEQPNAFVYDLRPCFNDSDSKLFVMTFPAENLRKGYESLIATKMHLKLREVTGVRKQRIFINEVIFSGHYLYVEFEIFKEPGVSSKSSNPVEITLDEALRRLKSSVDNKNFTLIVPVGQKDVFVHPEPGGLNEYSGDRLRKSTVEGYKEGSVIGLVIGMLLLGILLGGVTLNLVMSKKFGVSLFQKSKYGNAPFSNSHESNM